MTTPSDSAPPPHVPLSRATAPPRPSHAPAALVGPALAFAVLRLRPVDLGLRRISPRDALAAIGATVLALALGGIASRLVTQPSSITRLHDLAALPLVVRVAVVLTAAVCEEFMYRGFGIEAIARLVGPGWRRNLPACIAMHFLIDGIFVLLVPALAPAD